MPATWSVIKNRHDGNGEVDLSATPDILFTRAFHRPTGLTADEEVWLVVTGLSARGDISLNGEFLGVVSPEDLTTGFDITSRLNLRNELELRLFAHGVFADENERPVWDSICLEMRTAD